VNVVNVVNEAISANEAAISVNEAIICERVNVRV